MENIIYKIENGEIIKGTVFNILLNHGDFTLVDLRVYSNGDLDCLGPITLDQLKDHLKSGKLTRVLPAKGRLFIPYIGHIITEHKTSLGSYGSDENLLNLIEDTIKKLQLNEDINWTCILWFRQWLINPTGENLEKLKLAYQKLPQEKKALFEVEYKDPLVKLMSSGETSLTKEQREYYLMDYFEGEWIQLH